MIEYYAKSSELLCLLSLNLNLEPVPEPFRLQSCVTLRVPFSVYTEFINSLPTDAASILLAGDLQVTKNLARMESPLLYNCFLRDMSFAIVKELYFAEKYHSKCTLILPSSYTSRLLTCSELNDIFLRECSDVELRLRDIADSYGFTLPPSVSPENLALYRIAVCLLYLSGVNGVPEYNYSNNIKNMC